MPCYCNEPIRCVDCEKLKKEINEINNYYLNLGKGNLSLIRENNLLKKEITELKKVIEEKEI